ncbi:sensor histidine kinase [Deinococcus radiodurans]|jgi:Osmosensitive K+ channel histidine kinase|uniref:histidine kinase n=1 Tax=Deinococcus radiodurans (strain ATCC 13939 / DSM 20539 / JCM 16871 / CCUG 27074 / LMG 4051 / NBRC 15346 / NCIMB 9279 / VKM B-1422 / R1) TaxID=243230 RepID=Q9RW09_DEIRA|nr:HAMP domain-containing sensor histidine kinase [Deinococcus radiodurans]AAF10438.1 sensor histidine kinase [Deinococcus radiodurans R1 = ATCC 13939 = DSM 20539]ANC71932.1 two-component sensor histidine kinase [Deinococcus radiodurans R1 = ATCC 13939 = DSM 20539]QEM70369.1 sensor histidine kinase [Deinococcus radiodurans]QIP28980.1 HAMP domain-containing histidine kinase [Deinococcus radiodurans]QIP32311.1 HAMP domain-containing histidine kinase [Deinococcus radiodurans]
MTQASSSAGTPAVFVVSPAEAQATALAAELPGTEVRWVADGDQLLREAHARIPQVVLLYSQVPGTPLGQVLGILRQRAELASTHWLAVGSSGLGDLLAAGADALIGDTTPPPALAAQVRTLLGRAAQQTHLQERLTRLQGRLDGWEHDEQVRDQLVHMLVHDLKNPIAAVIGLLQIVEDDDGLSNESRELLRLCRDESQHLLHLTVNMLDVRKIQAGKMNLRRELMFSPMFEEVIELARGDVGSSLRERRVGVQVARDLNPVSADPEILRRVLANLLSNALKHSLSGSAITVSVQAERGGGGVRLSVRDHGEGIPAEDIPNLFAAFEQSRLTLHGRFDTGMGLAFCKMAIEQHDGRIWVESVRGEGSEFFMTLPYAQDPEDGDDDDYAELLT